MSASSRRWRRQRGAQRLPHPDVSRRRPVIGERTARMRGRASRPRATASVVSVPPQRRHEAPVAKVISRAMADAEYASPHPPHCTRNAWPLFFAELIAASLGPSVRPRSRRFPTRFPVMGGTGVDAAAPTSRRGRGTRVRHVPEAGTLTVPVQFAQPDRQRHGRSRPRGSHRSSKRVTSVG